jgi:DNA-binding PadR family transcriptional regulator
VNTQPINPGIFQILLALADGEQHGYSIAKAVEAASEGAVSLGPTTLYRYLKQLADDGWIEELDLVDPNDPRRRIYRLTPRGRRVAQAEALRLAQALRVAKACKVLPAAVRI